MSYFLGIDGGGTNTRAAIVDSTGQILGWGSSGPSNYDDVGRDTAKINIAEAILRAWQRAAIAPQPFETAFFGMAGVVSPTDRHVIRAIAAELDGVPVDQIGIDHDCRIALAGGLIGHPGIVLISGTGSSCYGRNAAGDDWRTGGWGQLISDEGSGYWFGLNAMRCSVRSFDGRDPPTRLLDAVLNRLRLSDVNDILHRLYVVGMSRTEIADLAPLVFETAMQGDGVARKLIDTGVSDLAECVYAVAMRLHLEKQPEIALTGGLHHAEVAFSRPLRQAILSRLPTAHINEPALSPVLGACLLALQSVGTLDDRVHNTLVRGEALMSRQ